MSLAAITEEAIAKAAERLHSEIGTAPKVAVVLGSGLGRLTERVQSPIRIPYHAIPGFQVPSIAGHKGEVVAGTVAGVPVVMQSGQFHMYEGHSAEVAAFPVRVFSALGADTLILTNASGGIRRSWGPGSLMLIADHINLTGRNPLAGPLVSGELRFPGMTHTYDQDLRRLALRVAELQGLRLEEGVYCGLLGPSFETPAEIKMLQTIGADAVGMSTVVEAIVARARGMRVLGFSLVANAAAGITGEELTEAEVNETAMKMAEKVSTLVEGIIREIR